MEIKKKAVWAIITARGGSKSIPLKNLVPICGKPLIEYCIHAAKCSISVERLFCTTDHERIASVAENCGVEIINRPSRLDGDMVPSIDVVIHALKQIAVSEKYFAETTLLIQPTSIF